MTQPPNPGQPFYQQQPSAPSTPVPGRPYPPRQQLQDAPGVPAAPGAPGQSFPQSSVGDNFMDNPFDTAKPFAEEFNKVLFYITTVAPVANWLYSAYNAGDIAGSYGIETQSRSLSFGKFLLSLLFDAPWIVTQISLIRLFTELIADSGKKNQSLPGGISSPPQPAARP